MAFGLSDEEHKSLILSVGSHKNGRRLSPFAVGRLFRKMIDNGARLEDCARLVHFDGTAMVTRFLKLLAFGNEGELAIGWGPTRSTIGFTSAFEITRLTTQDQQDAWHAAIENSMTGSEVKQLVQYRLRSGKAIRECISQILKMRPQVERRFLYIGRIDDAKLVEKLEGMSHLERDSALKRALAALDPRLEASSGKLTANRFSVVGDAEASRILLSQKPDFEHAVVDQLKQSVVAL